MRVAVSFFLLLFLPGSAYAEASHVERIDVTDYGIYSGTPTGAVDVPGAELGTISGLGNIRHAQNTRTIPARLGLDFGFRYIVVGSPTGAAVPLHLVIIFPSSGLINPATHQVGFRYEFDYSASIGESRYLGYSFDHEWDLAPGGWTFQIWNQGRILAEQRFSVVKPAN